ncbi:MAG: S26 family signal peptidase [Fibrobacter sp.]|nr:S26 family signal peptidase [Fibrobacter sp.]
MASLKQKLKSIHRRNSERHTLLLFFVLLTFFCLSATIRYYVLIPLRLMDSSMAPEFKEHDVVWMCKLPFCLDSFKEGDIVWASLRGNEMMVRKVLALPGDTIHISDQGRVTTPRQKFKWKNEDSFIQSRSFYVPKAGDTLLFDQLNDVEQDYIIGYLKNKGQHIVLKTTLWQGEHEISMDRVGATKIANRQVSLNEVDFLPWQDRFLIETQIRQSEPGNAPISLRRQIFLGETPLQRIPIDEDCYYLTCSKGDNCPDSRETGYITADKISGRYVEWPTRIDKAIISPAFHYAHSGFRIISDIFNNVVETASSLFNKIRSFFGD